MNNAKRGLKRKRWESGKSEVDVSSKFSGKLHSSLKEVQRAAKKAKVYETQRIVKRLKISSSLETDEISSTLDLEAELKALKLLDTDVIMKSALLTRVKKDGVLSRDERVQIVVENLSDSLDKSTADTKESSMAKVEARIRSSKRVAEIMKECVESLRNLVLGKEKKKRDSLMIGDDGDGEDSPVNEGRNGTSSAAAENEAEALSDASSEETDAHEATTDVNQTGGADDEREEGDGFDDFGWESGSLNSAGNLSEQDVGADDLSDWESGSGDRTQTSPRKKAKTRGTKSAGDLPTKPPVQAAQSTFLPSLAVGYVRGDSSDDRWSDAGDSMKERKNRRGQRARRAIWEKKFGTHANHVKKRRDETLSKKIAKTDSRFPRSNWNRRNVEKTGPGRRSYHHNNNFSSDSAAKSMAVKEQPMHPSWIAKRKAKEREAGSVKEAGTKIRFD